MSEQRRRDAMFSVRLTHDELAAVQKRAAKAGLSVSAYLRGRALEGIVCHCGQLGRIYFHTPGLVSTGPINYSSRGPVPQAVVLCRDHAMEKFSVAFGATA